MPDGQTNYQKARLEIEGQAPLTCWFNPQQYTISKLNQWTATPVVGASLPTIQFGGGMGRELTLQLLFDASDSASKDVRSVTDRLFMMMEVTLPAGGDPAAARPPTVTFAWGPTVGFTAVARQLNIQYTLFGSSGAPIRALCTLTLVQVAKADSRSTSGPAEEENSIVQNVAPPPAVHTVSEGDSLPSIAKSALGDASRWREIAQANEIDDPLHPPRGQSLAIPRRSGP
jgi:Contractile injection system tube protein/LysM domain